MPELYDIVKINTQKNSAILDIGTVMEPLVTMTTPTLQAGTYMISFSFEANFHNQKNQPMRSQITGDFAGEVYTDSVGDNDDGIKTRSYQFPKVWAGGPITLGLQASKSTAFAAQLDVNFVDVNIMRVG